MSARSSERETYVPLGAQRDSKVLAGGCSEAPAPVPHRRCSLYTAKELVKARRGSIVQRGSIVLERPPAIPADDKAEPLDANAAPSAAAPSAAPSARSSCAALRGIILSDFTAGLLLFWPLGCASYYLGWGDSWTFWLNFCAMVPLAKLMGDATEELAVGLNSEALGGLLNATFGNAVEMILTVQTLRAGELNVVKGTLLGSILSNLLLVLGMSFFAGGLTRQDGKVMGKEQSFSKEAALTNMTMLFLASATFALPTVLFNAESMNAYSPEDKHHVVLSASRWCSIYIMSAYVAFLIFQLGTHAELFKSEEGEEEEEDAKASLSPTSAMLLLFVVTCFVAASSEWLVSSIDGLVDSWHISKAFIGIVLLPIVGNACEHAGAIRMAVAEKVDITIGIAIGSSTQVALFVVPFSVLMGWALGQPMDLEFGSMDTTVMLFAVLIAFSITTDGSSNWFEGWMLMIAYTVIATLYWFVPEAPLAEVA